MSDLLLCKWLWWTLLKLGNTNRRLFWFIIIILYFFWFLFCFLLHWFRFSKTILLIVWGNSLIILGIKLLWWRIVILLLWYHRISLWLWRKYWRRHHRWFTIHGILFWYKWLLVIILWIGWVLLILRISLRRILR